MFLNSLITRLSKNSALQLGDAVKLSNDPKEVLHNHIQGFLEDKEHMKSSVRTPKSRVKDEVIYQPNTW